MVSGDFLMNHMDLLTGYVDIAKSNGVTSPDYRVFSLVSQQYLSEYLLYLFQNGYRSKIFFGYGRGVSHFGRWRLRSEQFNNFFLPLPPLSEQKQISDYLDRKTQQIDDLIEKTERKIELLKEQRSSLINQCVTKGLNLNVEMKDSGVEWIGEIPKGWEIERLKYFSKVVLSSVDRHILEEELRVSICHYPNVYNNEMINEKTVLPFGTCTESEFEKFHLRAGNILLTKDPSHLMT